MTQASEQHNGNPFEGMAVISSYTRAQALEDGYLVDVTETAKEAGFRYPLVVSRAVWDGVCEPPPDMARFGQSATGRLWDVLTMAMHAVRAAKRRNDTVDRTSFEVLTQDEPVEGKLATRHLWIHVGPGDTHEPVLTIMLQGED